MLSIEDLMRVAAREARDSQCVAVDAELSELIGYLPRGVDVVRADGDGISAVDVAFFHATRVLGAIGSNGHAHTPESISSFDVSARRHVLVCLPASTASLGHVLDQLARSTHGLRIDRVIASFGTLEPSGEGFVLRELAPQVSARDVQAQVGSDVPLLAGPDLSEIEFQK